MVKIVYCISKISRLSDAEFHRYWRDVHGPIAGRIPGCRKYVQRNRQRVRSGLHGQHLGASFRESPTA